MWGVKGEEVQVPWKLKYTWEYLWVAVEPMTGEVVPVWMPTVNKGVAETFLQELQAYWPDSKLVVIWDNAGWHHHLPDQEGITLKHLPAYSPQLNPVERLNEEIRKVTANQVWDELADKTACVDKLLADYFEHPEKVKQLTLFPWIKEQLEQKIYS